MESNVARLSIIIPVYNEVESLPHLMAALRQVDAELPAPWQVLFVDDGSTDGSQAYLAALAQEAPEQVRVIAFRRNFGQTAAMAAGIAAAEGEIIVFMDADLQNDPADIPMLLQKIAEGHDVVCGWRQHRQDHALTRRLPSQVANALIGRVTGVRLHDYGCTLKAFRREVITNCRLYGEMHRFIPVYAAQVGGSILEVPVRHHARQFGRSKYGLGRITRVLPDLCVVTLLTRYATKPMHLFGRVGLTCLSLAAATLLALLASLLVTPLRGGAASALAVVTVVLGTAGVQAILCGLLAEWLMRTYYESQGRPPYHIKHMMPGDAAPRETTIR